MLPDTLSYLMDYIEKNLKTDITFDELAKIAGYSAFHLSRNFSAAVGIPLSGYILNRRLKNALFEISQGRKAVDVILEYGFETYPGFYKAFVREYGCSPKKYLSLYSNPVIKPAQREVINMNITRNQIKEILRNWDIDQRLEIHDVEYMGGAKIADDVFKIGEDYYLRIRADRNRQLKNIAIAKAINSQGLGSALPVKTIKGNEYIDDEELSVLTIRVKGTRLGDLECFSDKRLIYAKQSGKAIGKLHKALQALEGKITCDESNMLTGVSEWALPSVRKQNEQWSMGLSDEFFTDYLDNFYELYDKLPRQIIHRDPNPSNILFENDVMSGFIDFDLSERNIRLFDPCYCSTGILCGANTDDECDKWLDILENLMKAYDDEVNLIIEEKRSVYYVLRSIQMICIAYFDTIDDPDFKRLTKQNRNMLRFIANNKQSISQIF